MATLRRFSSAFSITRGTPFGLARVLAIVVAALLFLGASNAFAQLTFLELDGNPKDLVPGPLPDDWDFVNTTGGNAAARSGLLVDAPPKTIFTTGGSKDDLDIPNWRCTDGNVPDKDEILNGMAALYTGNVLYFAGDRFAQNGDANIGFWLFQNEVGCDVATGLFSGVHSTGDLLILCDFVNGGATSAESAWRTGQQRCRVPPTCGRAAKGRPDRPRIRSDALRVSCEGSHVLVAAVPPARARSRNGMPARRGLASAPGPGARRPPDPAVPRCPSQPRPRLHLPNVMAEGISFDFQSGAGLDAAISEGGRSTL